MTKDGWDATVENFTYEASEVDVYNNAPTPKAINVSKKQQWQKVVIVFGNCIILLLGYMLGRTELENSSWNVFTLEGNCFFRNLLC